MKQHRPVRFPAKNRPAFGSEAPPNLVYGKNPVHEVLRAGRRRVLEIGITAEVQKSQSRGDPLFDLIQKQRVPVRVKDGHELDHLAGTTHHQGVVARVEPYPFVELETYLVGAKPKSLVLMLDSITDPQNFGALCRSALAFGVDAIMIPKDRSVTVTPSVCKSSSGAVEHLVIVPVGNLVITLHKLKEHKFWVYGAHLTLATTDLPGLDPAERAVLVVGSEGKGIRELVGKTCDVLFKIPMVSDFDSLNVAQAGTVCLYELARKMGKM